MSKLKRAVEGQIIQFLALPKIFNTLSADLPSGAIKLPNGETAYWRLDRNVAELKNFRTKLRELSLKMAQALRQIVTSEAFLNHYGITKSPELPSDKDLSNTFRSLLYMATNKVDYSSVSFGAKKTLIESIQVPLGNLVFFNAVRGSQTPPKAPGIKGKLWLSPVDDENQFFYFTIASPVVALSDYIGEDRLKNEIANKLKHNLRALTTNPKIVFEDGQFDNYVGRSLQQLVEQHNSNSNSGKKQKNKKEPIAATTEGTAEAPVVGRGLTNPVFHTYDDVAYFNRAITPAEFEPMELQQKAEYLNSVKALLNDPTGDWTIVRDFLNSGVMVDAYEAHLQATPEDARMSHSYFLGRLILEITPDQINYILNGGSNLPLESDADKPEEIQGSQDVVETTTTSGSMEENVHPEIGDVALSKEAFSALPKNVQVEYLEAIKRQTGDRSKWPLVRDVLNSGIIEMPADMAAEESFPNSTYIGRFLLGMTPDLIDEVLGNNDAFNAEVVAQQELAAVGDAEGEEGLVDSADAENELEMDEVDTADAVGALTLSDVQDPARFVQAAVWEPESTIGRELVVQPSFTKTVSEEVAETTATANGFTMDRQDAAALIEDVNGSMSRTADPVDVQPGLPAILPGTQYTVVHGDTLSHIAQRAYGNAELWPKIHEANKDSIENPDLIFPGQDIQIP